MERLTEAQVLHWSFRHSGRRVVWLFTEYELKADVHDGENDTLNLEKAVKVIDVVALNILEVVSS